MDVTLFTASLLTFLKDESGQELAEFALILSAFSVIAMVSFAFLASTANLQMNAQQNSVNNAAVNIP
ncbi:MAG TPA: hypothetical protein VKG44_02815 [Candidatus Baltobacteraceae bacterium]|nr:hypothetical protein [Candidatus Baltobacteraceae bacterium]